MLNYSANHINVEVNDPSRRKWQFIGFYGFPEGGERRASWDCLRSLLNATLLPRCILDDFKYIMDDREKQGGFDRARWLLNGFRQVVSNAGLVDVFKEGYLFTWFKSLGTPRAVEERLDYALANEI